MARVSTLLPKLLSDECFRDGSFCIWNLYKKSKTQLLLLYTMDLVFQFALNRCWLKLHSLVLIVSFLIIHLFSLIHQHFLLSRRKNIKILQKQIKTVWKILSWKMLSIQRQTKKKHKSKKVVRILMILNCLTRLVQ